MTQPTITYGHGDLRECDSITGWVETRSGMTDPETVFSSDGDVFTLQGTCNDPGDEYFHETYTLPASISSDTFTKFIVRWKTSATQNAFGAIVELVFSVGNQYLLEATGVPQFSTAAGQWMVTSGTITAGKTITGVRLWANDDPNTIDSGTSYVYYDFVLLHRGTFTFPFVSNSVTPTIENRYVDIEIWGRVGDITQYGGQKSIGITVSGDIDTGTGWDGPDNYDLEWLYNIMFEADGEPWQWFTSDRIKCKVTPRKLSFPQEPGKLGRFELELKKYSLVGESGREFLFWNGLP